MTTIIYTIYLKISQYIIFECKIWIVPLCKISEIKVLQIFSKSRIPALLTGRGRDDDWLF
jgi:hypothetical protein